MTVPTGFLPAIKSGVNSAQNMVQSVEDTLIEPAVDGIFAAPLNVAEAIGKIEIGGVDIYDVIPNDTGYGSKNQIKNKIEGWLGFDRREREIVVNNPNDIPNQVTLLPIDNDINRAIGRRSIWNMFEEEGVKMTSGTIEEPSFSWGGSNNETTTRTVFAPFSIYTPTVLWPYASNDGSRYTVHDFANTPLESDFLGAKPIVEVLAGRKLDRYGALPGFAKWGDPLLGTGPVVIGGTAVALLGLTAFLWGPAIGRSLASTAQSAVFGTLELAKSVGSKAKDVAKAPF